MSRTQAQALVLINWRGVFYERYHLDRRVTALEGANGSGKTTVMIAAYVVLLPDMSRLRFTTLGESGATGGDKGIWGRLGESGRPSYAVLDLVLGSGIRLLAGVLLERKGEPSVEPTPFIITGVGPEIGQQELLLLRQGADDVVPELDELREQVARLGGRLQPFASAREYFAALFDHGVTPLRLSSEEERTKLNDMLRTSMAGGILRALTSELRAFLLKEESALAETLARMKANLDACRRTRTEVEESQHLEAEIGGVFVAGQAMFAAACLATRARAEEYARRVEEAAAASAARAREHALALAAHAQALAAEQALERAQAQDEAARTSAQEGRERLSRALALRTTLAKAEQTQAETRARAQVETNAWQAAHAAVEREHARRTKCERHQTEAAAGLADLQRGVAELHRRAGAYRLVRRRLEEAERLNGQGSIAPEELAPCLDAARQKLAAVDAVRREGRRRLEDADHHRRSYSRALAALAALRDGPLAPGDTDDAAAADAALRAQRARLALAERLPALTQDLAATKKKASQQAQARAAAATLGIVGESQAALIPLALAEAEAAAATHHDAAREAQRAEERAAHHLAKLVQTRAVLRAREVLWATLLPAAARIAAHLNIALAWISTEGS